MFQNPNKTEVPQLERSPVTEPPHASVNPCNPFPGPQRIEEERAHLAAIVESSQDAIISKDLAGNIRTWNAAAEKLFGYSTHEMIGQSIMRLVPPECQAEEATLLERLRDGQSMVQFESVRLARGGRRIPVSLTLSPIRDAAGANIGASTILRDITLRKREEEALRDSEMRFRTAFEKGPIAMALTSLDGKLLKVNSVFCGMLGFSETELVGRSFAEITHPDDLPVNLSGFQQVCSGEAPSFRMEKRYVRKDGAVAWGDMGMAAVRDAQGLPFYFVTHIQDITERKRAEDALHHSEALLRRSQEIAHLGSWELDLLTDQVTWSDEVYRIFGLERQQFGATYTAFLQAVHPEDRLAVDSAYSRSLREGEDTYEIEHRVVRKSTGEIRFVHEKCEHIRDASNRIVRSVGMVHDITDRKKAEVSLALAKADLERHNQELEQRINERTAKLQRALTEMEHFSYAIVHDLRAPLRAMQGFAELAERECTGDQHALTRSYLDRVKAASRRMDELIRDSLSYSKAIREELPLQPVNLVPLLRDLVETYPQLHPSQADIRIEGDFPSVLGNQAGLTQCFGNLLENAVKFTKPGAKPQVRVWAEAPQPPARFVRIWIEDKGIGIPKAAHLRIFGMFQRSSNDHEGTGIGLAIVRKVVERMGGNVGVESEEDSGSRFWVDLPRAT